VPRGLPGHRLREYLAPAPETRSPGSRQKLRWADALPLQDPLRQRIRTHGNAFGDAEFIARTPDGRRSVILPVYAQLWANRRIRCSRGIAVFARSGKAAPARAQLEPLASPPTPNRLLAVTWTAVTGRDAGGPDIEKTSLFALSSDPQT
jgi:hypothetical protein